LRPWARRTGSQTHDVEGWAVTITAKINRTMDWVRWDSARVNVPEGLWPVQEKPVLDTKGVKWLKENDPANYAVVASCMTSKPGKTAVTIKKG
jgi:hypothetical protein